MTSTLTQVTRAQFNAAAVQALADLNALPVFQRNGPCPMPKILWDLTGTSAGGKAYGTQKIRLHPKMAAAQGTAYLNTVIHEIAHIVVNYNRPPTESRSKGRWSSHGPVWKHAMISVGADPARCFESDEDLMKAMNPNVVTVKVTCKCTKVHTITERQAKRVLGPGVSCRKCRTQFVRVAA